MMDKLPWSLTGLFLYLSGKVNAVTSSGRGEKTWVYTTCLRNCLRRCEGVINADTTLAWLKNVIHGTCWEQCPYVCMWNTVHAYELDRSTVIPKFYGKWPYLRFFGMDKPLTCLVCAVSVILHLLLLKHFHRKVPNRGALFYAWHIYTVISVNHWLWAFVFYCRERQTTEHIHQLSTMFHVVCSTWLAIIRVGGTRELWKPGLVSVVVVTWLIYHLYWHLFLCFGPLRLRTTYDEQALAMWGLFGTFLWIFHAVQQRAGYTWKLKLVLTGNLMLGFLQSYDFPPFLWLVDVDTLSHAGDTLMTLLWYSYAVDDCQHVMKMEAQEEEKKKQ